MQADKSRVRLSITGVICILGLDSLLNSWRDVPFDVSNSDCNNLKHSRKPERKAIVANYETIIKYV